MHRYVTVFFIILLIYNRAIGSTSLAHRLIPIQHTRDEITSLLFFKNIYDTLFLKIYIKIDRIRYHFFSFLLKGFPNFLMESICYFFFSDGILYFLSEE